MPPDPSIGFCRCYINWGNTQSCSKPIVMSAFGSSAGGLRFMAIGSNPFQDGMTAALKRVIPWLVTGGSGTYSSATLRIANAYGTSINSWFSANNMVSNITAQSTYVRLSGGSTRADLIFDADSNDATDAAYATAPKLLILDSGLGSDSNSADVIANTIKLLKRVEREGNWAVSVQETEGPALTAARTAGVGRCATVPRKRVLAHPYPRPSLAVHRLQVMFIVGDGWSASQNALSIGNFFGFR